MPIQGSRHGAFALLLVVLAICCWSGICQLFYPANGALRQVDAPQLWYNGYWKHVRDYQLQSSEPNTIWSKEWIRGDFARQDPTA